MIVRSRHPRGLSIKVLGVEGPKLPVHKEWPEDESPYQPVARLVLPVQDAYSAGRQTFVEEELSFCPAHCLAAHRPLGSIMRARMQAYEVLGRGRRRENGSPLEEPRSIHEMPGLISPARVWESVF